jgi:hypothetical protein
VHQYGIMATSINTTIGYFVLLVLVFWMAQRNCPIPYEYKRIGIILLAAVLTYIAGKLIHVDSLMVSTLLKCLSLLIFPIALILLGFFDQKEQTTIKRFGRSLLALITQSVRPD